MEQPRIEHSIDELSRGRDISCDLIPTVQDITSSILRFESLDTIFNKIFLALQEFFFMKEMFIALFDEKKNLFVVNAVHGFPPEDGVKIRQMGLPPEQIQMMTQEKFRIGTNSYYVRAEEWSYFNPKDPFYDHPERLTIPRNEPTEWHEAEFFNYQILDRHGILIGFLEICDSLSGKLPTIEEAKAMEVFSDLVGIAIENHRMYEEAVSDEQFSELISDILVHDVADFAEAIIKCGDKLVESHSVKTDSKPLIDHMKMQSENISALLSQVQRIANARKRRQKMDYCVDLVASVQRSAIEMLKIFPNKGLRFSFNPPNDRCLARADELVEEVFVNIFNNAIKNDPDQRINIDISIEPHLKDDRDFWMVNICDHGSGIPDEEKENLFEKYRWTLEEPSSNPGLGLFISKTLISGYGGDIWVDDRVKGKSQEGSRFCVLVPKFSKTRDI